MCYSFRVIFKFPLSDCGAYCYDAPLNPPFCPLVELSLGIFPLRSVYQAIMPSSFVSRSLPFDARPSHYHRRNVSFPFCSQTVFPSYTSPKIFTALLTFPHRYTQFLPYRLQLVKVVSNCRSYHRLLPDPTALPEQSGLRPCITTACLYGLSKNRYLPYDRQYNRQRTIK